MVLLENVEIKTGVIGAAKPRKTSIQFLRLHVESNFAQFFLQWAIVKIAE